MIDSLLASLQSLQGLPAYALVFGLLAGTGFGLPMSEDLLLLTAAALTLRGVMDPVGLVAVAWAAILVADGLTFHWGRVFGPTLLRHRRLARVMPPARLAAMQATMLRHGPAFLFLVRFMPGVRSALLFAAGSLKTPYRHLFFWDGLAAAIELPLLVWGVRYVGGRWEEILALLRSFQWVLAAAVVAALAVFWAMRRRRRG